TKKSFRVSERMPAGNVAGVRAGGLIWLSAIRGEGEGVQAECRAALEGLKKNLASGGADLNDLVKATVYVHDIGDRAAVPEGWMEYFGAGETAPARVMVEIANASLRAGGDSRFVLDIVALAAD